MVLGCCALLLRSEPVAKVAEPKTADAEVPQAKVQTEEKAVEEAEKPKEPLETPKAAPAVRKAVPEVKEAVGDIRSGAELMVEEPADFRVALRPNVESLPMPKLPWSTKLPRSLLEGVDEGVEACPDGSVRLRVFDPKAQAQEGDIVESLSISLTHPCIIMGSSFKAAHLADSHSSVKLEHAALIFSPQKGSTPSGFLLQPINGDVTMTSASAHGIISNLLLRERRTAPVSKMPAKLLSVGSAPEELTRQLCCFQLAKSELLYFLDLLPSAASVRALGPSRHLLTAFVDGRRPEARRPREAPKEEKPPAAERINALEVGLRPRAYEGLLGARRGRSPSVWRHDMVQRSPSHLVASEGLVRFHLLSWASGRASSPNKRQRAPSSESLPKRTRSERGHGI